MGRGRLFQDSERVDQPMYIADLHIHSKYSRATSRDCVPEMLEFWARRKGIGLIGTGDFTHPAWRAELQEKLVPAEEGLLRLREELRLPGEGAAENASSRFVVSGEISSIYKQDGRVRKVHNLILLPGLSQAETLSRKLEAIGNLHSDGRPILGLSSRDLCEITFECCPQAIFIPAHIWTPHFSLFGAFSGFDTIEECFGDMTPQIFALETGLSSDPPMNWRLSALDRYALVSNSDAHSPARLGREANLIEAELSYPALAEALRGRHAPGLAGTIEFYPEEGKYHFDGHRPCKVCLSPQQFTADGRCPVCGRKLTVGVLHRVEQLSDRQENYRPENPVPFESLVPLEEVLCACLGCAPGSVRAARACQTLIRELGPEFTVLRESPLEEVSRLAGPIAAEGVRRMRAGELILRPGYDGEYGRIELFSAEELADFSGQTSLFGPAKKLEKAADPQKRAGVGRLPKLSEKPAPPAKKPKKRSADPLQGLNEQQRAAAAATERAAAVIAGPGTGKTRTLIAHLCCLVSEHGIPPQEITAVTFTNRAAAELRGRLGEALGRRGAGRVQVGTFHALCLHLLRGQEKEVSVIGESEAQALAAGVLSECSLRLRPGRFLETLSQVKNGILEEEKLEKPLAAALSRYRQLLEQYGALDYDDLLLRVLWQFESGQADPALQASFHYLLVDEFQDINPLQYRLIQALGKNGKQIFVIGDPDQAIYGFRGSDAHCFERFAADFPDARQVRLTENYRSSPAILRCALPAILPNGGEARVLHANCPEGAPVSLLQAKDEMGEAIAIAKEISRLVGGVDMLQTDRQEPGMRQSGGSLRGFSEIAVLYRTHRQAQALETALAHEGIPYVAVGRDRLLQEKSVQGILGFLRLMLQKEDKLSLQSALRLLFDCPAALSEAFGSWWSASGPEAPLAPGLAEKVELTRFLALYTAYLPRSGEPPLKLLEALSADCGLSDRLPVLRLMNMAVLHQTLPEFLDTLCLGAEGDVARSGGRTYSSDAVSLLTLHAAKGLEYPVVFLCGLKKGILPLSQLGRHADIPEERRLFYVGLTRAKQELFLSYAGESSEFLLSLPKEELRCENSGPALETGKQLSLF